MSPTTKMPRTITVVALFTLFLMSGCRKSSSATPLIRNFGSSFSPDTTKRLEVTRREKSLVDFQVFAAKSGGFLIGDSIGSDAMRWFLYWETPVRLWGFGSDIRYFKLFEFNADGTVTETEISRGSAVPAIVRDNLPSSMQTHYERVRD